MEDSSLQKIPRASESEKAARKNILRLFKETPIPDKELLDNLNLFVRPQQLSSLLAKQKLYLRILNVHGIVMEFGVRWGQNLVLFSSLRSIYEPYNFYRKIVGFDTFQGFPSISKEDGLADIMKTSAFNVTPDYEVYLEEILSYHEAECPLSHIRRFELRKGDAIIEIKKYLQEYPETIIAFAYFDLDLYLPTKECLQAILPHLTRGSIIAFDELGHREFPGETIALKEILGTSRYKLRRSPFHPAPSYIVIE